MAELKRFAGEYRDEDGRTYGFDLMARDRWHAEHVLERIAVAGQILGEIVEEGEVDATYPFAVGRA